MSGQEGAVRRVVPVHVFPWRIHKGGEQFFLPIHKRWADDGQPLVSAFVKKHKGGRLGETFQAILVEAFDGSPPPVRHRIGLPSCRLTLRSPTAGVVTEYLVRPLLARFERNRHDRKFLGLCGEWLTRTDALKLPNLSPTARAALGLVRKVPDAPIDPRGLQGTLAERLAYARDCDQRALGPILTEMSGLIVSRVSSYSLSPDDIADLLGEAHLLATANLPLFRDGGSPAAWLASIADNAALTLLRRRGSGPRFQSDGDEALAASADQEPGPLETIEQAETIQRGRQALERVLSRRPESWRLAWEMRMREDMPYEEIGEALKVPSNTVSTWVYRIREELKAEAARLQG